MDKVTDYRQIMQNILEDYAERMSRGNQVRILAVCDTKHDQYLLISLGWSNQRREHAIVFHAQICQGRIIIEDDRTEEGIGDALVEAGVADADVRAVWMSNARVNDEMSLVA
ncbi:MAG: element excision factor XisI family protein [Blastocatellia bacterium]